MKRENSNISGVLVVNKAGGMTSHDVVNRIRRLYGTRVVGHTGTLDPMATGVLCVLIGRAAKAAEYIVADTKHYSALLRLGETYDTGDVTGNLLTKSESIPTYVNKSSNSIIAKRIDPNKITTVPTIDVIKRVTRFANITDLLSSFRILFAAPNAPLFFTNLAFLNFYP